MRGPSAGALLVVLLWAARSALRWLAEELAFGGTAVVAAALVEALLGAAAEARPRSVSIVAAAPIERVLPLIASAEARPCIAVVATALALVATASEVA
jgi:hypothetical protein